MNSTRIRLEMLRNLRAQTRPTANGKAVAADKRPRTVTLYG